MKLVEDINIFKQWNDLFYLDSVPYIAETNGPIRTDHFVPLDDAPVLL